MERRTYVDAELKEVIRPITSPIRKLVILNLVLAFFCGIVFTSLAGFLELMASLCLYLVYCRPDACYCLFYVVFGLTKMFIYSSYTFEAIVILVANDKSYFTSPDSGNQDSPESSDLPNAFISPLSYIPTTFPSKQNEILEGNDITANDVQNPLTEDERTQLIAYLLIFIGALILYITATRFTLQLYFVLKNHTRLLFARHHLLRGSNHDPRRTDQAYQRNALNPRINHIADQEYQGDIQMTHDQPVRTRNVYGVVPARNERPEYY
mmetsp:Transcript_12849/g.14113  ORF Transcript_12849/g.14113 Transcript_12849/m.14113 type:complete len:266 (+) Transcript_12849:68-865(+)